MKKIVMLALMVIAVNILNAQEKITIKAPETGGGGSSLVVSSYVTGGTLSGTPTGNYLGSGAFPQLNVTRVNNMVWVTGACEFNSTGYGYVTLRMALPIPSNLASSYDVLGALSWGQISGGVSGNTAQKCAEFNVLSPGMGWVNFRFSFSYPIR